MGLDKYRSKRSFSNTPEPVLAAVDATGSSGRVGSLADNPLPQLATLVEDIPVTGLWLAETKLDGYRLLAQVGAGEVRLWTRSHQDWSAQLPSVVAELQRLPLHDAWLDGELVVLDRAGHSSFSRLQQALTPGPPPPGLRYYLFDLLALDGEDLRGRPQLERKERLRELLAGTVQEVLAGSVLADAGPGGGERCLRYCGHVVGRLDEAFRAACLQGEEGLLLKRADAPYRGGRGHDWLKLKCAHRQEFVVGGYRLVEGRWGGLGGLLVGYYTAAGALAYAGRVGSGFDQAALRSLLPRLSALPSPDCPFGGRLPPSEAAGALWVQPGLVVDLRFAGWTRSGRLRQARFHGLREDKPAREVRRELALLPSRPV